MVHRFYLKRNAGIYAGRGRPCRTHGIAIPADVKEQIFEYANLIGEEEKVRTLVRNLADAINQTDKDKVEGMMQKWIFRTYQIQP